MNIPGGVGRWRKESRQPPHLPASNAPPLVSAAQSVQFDQMEKQSRTTPMKDLVTAATAARESAHAPYSGFKVGAAIRTASGRIFTGCNVENIAYPEGTCAEAGAIAAMVAAGEREIAEVLVIAGGEEPVSPCGGCRQKLAEFGAPDVPVTMATTSGRIATAHLGELLPGAFSARHMAGDGEGE